MMRYVKICPRCGSIDIGVPKRGMDLVDMRSLCRSCGNIGVFPEVEIEKVEEFKKSLKEGTGDMR